MKRLLIILFTLTGSGHVLAQNVDFEIPTEINIIEGRLAVAFKDGIREADARALVESLGYDALQVNFKPLSAVAGTPTAMSEEVLSRLKATDGVLDVHEGQRPENTESLTTSPLPPDIEMQRYKTWVKFQSHLSQSEAEAILGAFTDVPFSFITKPANEIVIGVGDDDEAAFARLDGHEIVKWVTYVGVAGG